jgi:hypothetical protein
VNFVTLGDALDEAKRFVRLAIELQRQTKGQQFLPGPSREVAAVKRASMDLTRALAKMRAPN